MRRCTLYSMIALFGVACVTLDRVPRSVLRVLRNQAEVTMRWDEVVRWHKGELSAFPERGLSLCDSQCNVRAWQTGGGVYR